MTQPNRCREASAWKSEQLVYVNKGEAEGVIKGECGPNRWPAVNNVISYDWIVVYGHYSRLFADVQLE